MPAFCGVPPPSEKLSQDEKPSNKEPSTQLKSYPRRWIILLISGAAICLRGFNQSCYGPINSVLSEYFKIQPWQVDWFILTQSVVFLSMALPLSWLTSRIGFKNSYIVMTIALAIGFALTTVGMSMRTGFPSAIVGQCIMGFSNIISWSIPPPTAAIWFPANEVATAVGLQVVGRGVGESVGSIITPLLVHINDPIETIRYRLLWLFIVVTFISVVLVVAVFLFVIDEPPLPPSESRAQVIKKKKEIETVEDLSFRKASLQYAQVIKDLFHDPYFVCIWLVFGVVNPVLRNNSVLLSSVLHTAFKDESQLNTKAGFVLMGGWIAYTIGGFIAGPLTTMTKRYKHIVLFSVGFECASALIVMIGIKVRHLICVYVGVVTTGLFLGMANTSLYEIVLEITYPKPPMLVTMVNIIGMGIFRLLYPIIGRFTLSDIGPTASTAFPFGLLLLATIVLAVINPPYKRLQAERGETQMLLEERD